MRAYLAMMQFGWRYARFYVIATFALAIVHQVVVFFEHVYSVKFIIDTIQYGGPFSQVLWYIGVIAAAVAACLVFGSWLDEYDKLRAKEQVHWGIQRELFAQAARLDLADYDDPSRYNDFVRAVNEAPERFDQMMERTKTVCVQIVSAASAAVLVLFLDPAGLFFAAVALGFSVFAALRQGTRQFALENELLPQRRKMSYLTRLFYLGDHAKELRLTPVAERLTEEYDASVEAAKQASQRHSRALVGLGFLQSFVLTDFAFRGVYLGYLVVQVVVFKQLSLGDLVALTAALSVIVRSLQAALAVLPDMRKDALYVAALQKFRDQKPSITAPVRPRPLPQGPWHLELDDVGFAYPGEGSTPVLSGLNLIIRAQEKIAVVGHNGAGKTTLTKLLMRLYDPTAGTIKLNGIDIREFDPDEYRTLVASVFQDFQIFAATVGENVVLDLIEDDVHRPALARALEQSGFGERLSGIGGLDTPLTREFVENGVNLSGGENQKIALARVFLRASPAAILDEPSSALDPGSEYRLNQNLAEAAREKAVVYISHRLSSTRMADRIVLLEHGRIVEEGTHAELVAANGRYAQMFAMQAERYRPPV